MVWFHLQANLTLLTDRYYMLGRCKRDNTGTPAYFMITFVTIFWETLLKYFWNIFEKKFEKKFIIFSILFY
jgi:hypothetical protein